MQLEISDNKLDIKTEEEVNDYLKTRVESLNLPIKIQNALISANIRTVGGIVRKPESSLVNIRGLGKKAIEDIKIKLYGYSEIYKKNQQAQAEARSKLNNFNDDLEETKSNSGVYLLPQKQVTEIVEEDDIIATFAKHFGLEKEIILSKTRKREIVEVRDLIAYFLREYADMSFPAIGKLLGGRDHTTIIYSYNKIDKSLDVKNNFESKFFELILKAKSIKERKVYIENTIIPEAIASIRAQIFLTKSKLQHKDISSRDIKILELYREGITIENIAKINKISRQRVDQIVRKTIEQIAINESLSKEIIIDADIILQEERKKRRNLIHKKIENPKSKINKEKRWTRYFIACVSCGTTTIPHVKRGLCENCSGRFRGDRRERIISLHDNKCNLCGISRHEAITNYKHDLYIMKDKKVFCQMCFLKNTGKKLGSYKNYTCSRFYPKCKSCGTTSTPHSKKVLCSNCINSITNEERKSIITQHNNQCDNCTINITDARKKFKRDLYITKSRKVLCRNCFQSMSVIKMRDGLK